MALRRFQRRVCQVIAKSRIEAGESYVAGAAALNELMGAARLSRDIDPFHDTDEAVESSWRADKALLEANGFDVSPIRVRAGFVEAQVGEKSESVLLQWTHDSAYRFFPLMAHPDLGLTLHPFDLATNKVLALVGRLEVRDWVDLLESCKRIQALGYLAWAAPGKDPGFGPLSILELAGRTARYTQEEVEGLAFAGAVPDAADLAKRWHEQLHSAREIVAALPPEEAGKCVLSRSGELCAHPVSALRSALRREELLFHSGAIRGSLPQLSG